VDLYKYAAQNKLVFPSSKGNLTVEQLFDLPLRSEVGKADLNSVAIGVSRDLKAMGEESFVEDLSANPQKMKLTAMLNLVKDVITTKQAENASKLAKAQRAVERAKILDAIRAQDDKELSTATRADLEKKLAALDENGA
jgi:hypothetical protein